ncbi:MAG: O-antigen ligase family protein [Burkholderiales bacterium]|jgi:O-antigen ligase|nr:O-antigen ligase family protein [Burkholderiales bacterium]
MIGFTERSERFASFLLSAILLFFPATLLISRDANNGFFYLAVFLGLAAIVLRLNPCKLTFGAFAKKTYGFIIAFAALTVAVLISQTVIQDVRLRYFELPMRLMAFPIVVYAFLLLPASQFKLVRFGLIAGALLNLVVFCAMTDFGAIRQNYTFRGFPVIPFADCALLVGMLSLTALFIPGQKRIVNVFLILAFFAGLYVSVAYQTRGGWVALLPYFLLMGYWTCRRYNKVNIKTLTGIVVMMILAGSAFLSVPIVKDRVDLARAEIALYSGGKGKDTSVGLRLQMYETAFLMAKEKPFFGVGVKKRLEDVPEINRMVEEKVITKGMLNMAHMHNDPLQYLFSTGVLGFLATLLLYLVPFFYFFKADKQSHGNNPFARLGIVTALSYFIFGMTDLMLYRDTTVNIYTMLLAIAVAFTIRQHYEEQHL